MKSRVEGLGRRRKREEEERVLIGDE